MGACAAVQDSEEGWGGQLEWTHILCLSLSRCWKTELQLATLQCSMLTAAEEGHTKRLCLEFQSRESL